MEFIINFLNSNRRLFDIIGFAALGLGIVLTGIDITSPIEGQVPTAFVVVASLILRLLNPPNSGDKGSGRKISSPRSLDPTKREGKEPLDRDGRVSRFSRSFALGIANGKLVTASASRRVRHHLVSHRYAAKLTTKSESKVAHSQVLSLLYS